MTSLGEGTCMQSIFLLVGIAAVSLLAQAMQRDFCWFVFFFYACGVKMQLGRKPTDCVM